MRDILFINNIKEGNKKKKYDKYICFKDKLVEMENFIISVSSTAIYNRFARCFGGKLKWFRQTPDKIIQLSKSIRSLIQDEDSNQYLDFIQNSLQLSQEHSD